MKQCIIFDMDGVIIDSEHIHMACEREIFRLLKISISDDEHHAFVGATDETMWTRIESSHELPINIPRIINLKRSLYMEYLKREVYIKPIPYVLELIVDLYKRGFLLALASSSPHSQINYILNDFRIKPYFHSIISGEDVENGKPNPEIFLKAANSVNVSPQSCVVVEDSYNGVTGAKKANMKCIGFINPNSGNQDLSKADMVISSFIEISGVSINGMVI